MSKYTFLGLAVALLAAGNAIKAYAEGTPEPITGETPTGDSATPTRGRGRPPKPAEESVGVPTDKESEARLAANKKLVETLVTSGHGESVKKEVSKYSQVGLKGIPLESQKAFEVDIAALVRDKMGNNVDDY